MGTALNGGAAGKLHLVVSKARPPEVTSGVALPLRFGADVTDSGDPAEPCNRPRTLSPGFRHALLLIRTSSQGFARVNRNAADCFPAQQSAPCSSRSGPLSAREAREGKRERTKDLRRRDDLVSLGVILGRLIELSWPLHANYHMSGAQQYNSLKALCTVTAWLPMLACTGTSF